MSAFLIHYHGEVVTIKRFGEGGYQDGIYQPGIEESIDIVASVLPAAPDEIKILTAGMETTAAIEIYSEDELKTGNKSGKTKPDIIVWNSREWQVHSVEMYRKSVGVYLYRSIAVLKDD
jgi:hypothetical protein